MWRPWYISVDFFKYRYSGKTGGVKLRKPKKIILILRIYSLYMNSICIIDNICLIIDFSINGLYARKKRLLSHRTQTRYTIKIN